MSTLIRHASHKSCGFMLLISHHLELHFDMRMKITNQVDYNKEKCTNFGTPNFFELGRYIYDLCNMRNAKTQSSNNSNMFYYDNTLIKQ